jgi:predicted transcriptional regulator
MSAPHSPPPPTRDVDDAEALEAIVRQSHLTGTELDNFDRAFGLVAFTLNRHIVDHLLRFSRHFGPDYPMMVVWGVLAHQSVIDHLPAGSRPRDVLDAKGRLATPNPVLRPVRQRDLSQITGIPKETVRRKLLKLEQAGWIVRQGPGWVINRSSHDPVLREFSRESTVRLLAAADHIRQLLRDAG